MISDRTLAFGGVVLALALVVFVAPFASTAPDGLERVAADHGIVAAEESAPGGSSTFAAVAGTLVVLALGVGLARLLARRRA